MIKEDCLRYFRTANKSLWEVANRSKNLVISQIAEILADEWEFFEAMSVEERETYIIKLVEEINA